MTSPGPAANVGDALAEAEAECRRALGRAAAESVWPGDRRVRAGLIGRALGRSSSAAGQLACEFAAQPGLMAFLDGLALRRGVGEGVAGSETRPPAHPAWIESRRPAEGGGPSDDGRSVLERRLRPGAKVALDRRSRAQISAALGRAGLLVGPGGRKALRERSATPASADGETWTAWTRDLAFLGQQGALGFPVARPETDTREAASDGARRVELPTEARPWGSVERAAGWLRLAFAGDPFPADDAAWASVDGGWVLVDGPFARLGPAARRDLWDYLRAVAVEDPDRAAGVLLRRLEGRPNASGAGKELRIRFRQAAPFRDGGWTESGQTVAEHVALHLLWVRRCGFRLDPESEIFFRGFLAMTRLFWPADAAPPSGSELDPWSEGLERLGWSTAAVQAREAWAAARAGRMAGAQLTALLGLPQRLQAWLERRAHDGSREGQA